MDISEQLRLLQRQLCVLPSFPPLAESMLAEIDDILNHRRAQRVLYPLDTLKPIANFKRGEKPDGRIMLWLGDITTLSGVTAITNAANKEGLGCFQPSHRCIDNVIHSWAGPRLRIECAEAMRLRGRALDPGDSITTKGYCLPSDHVIHVVGPSLTPNANPNPIQFEQLEKCYVSVLDAMEALPPSPNGRKSVAFCCISTGLFAFPAQQAAITAVTAVEDWLNKHQDTTVTDIIFNTFTKDDSSIYQQILQRPPAAWLLPPSFDDSTTITCDNFERAKEWLASAEAVIVSAGAGLSAADGLDYTSQALFAKKFPGFLKYGLRTLYSVFGFTDWPSEQDRWGYYYTHLNMIRNWPKSSMYGGLLSWLERFGPDAHIRTSNADGLFIANGCPADKISTPQGTYAILQCMENCRPEATMPSEPFVSNAVPALHPVSQRLLDPRLVPKCRFCDSKMHICVRAASWFNSTPFQEGEERWRTFRRRILDEDKQVVILEVGVGMSTPGVLRWPNEKLVRSGHGKVRLIRIGLGHDSAVPQDLDENELALSIDGDIRGVLEHLLH
jgi:O-acetyl-ADP-ribose deacetylase (regulator of RNase III)/NAD-dependent SIR2 family protein deacetylase